MAKRQAPLIWLGAAFAVFAGGVVVAALAIPGGVPPAEVPMALAAAVLGLAAVLFAAVWRILRVTLLRPARRLAVEVRARLHGEQRRRIDTVRFAALPGLAEAVNELIVRLAEASGAVATAIAKATAGTETEKGRLAAILNDLNEGVVVCNLKHQVVLYNQVALGLLRVSGEIGLGRSLFGLVVMEPVGHMIEVLTHRAESAPGSAPFITATPDGMTLLQGRVSLVRAAAEVTGYVVTFNDVTPQVAALARRDALLRELIERLRRPASQLGQGEADHSRLAVDVVKAFDRAREGYRSLMASWWPMTDIHSAYLFDLVSRRLENSGLKVNLTGLPLWLHGDSHSLVLALEGLLRSIAKGTGSAEFDLSAEAEGGHGWVCVTWRGERVDDDSLIAWQKAALPALGGMTVRDVMMHHTREDLIEEAHGGAVTLRVALSLGREGQDRNGRAERLPPRPEFFDFDLLAQGGADEIREQPLSGLTYVVFDTETTGLHPTQGDQVVSLAAVRIVNGRILTGETFNRIVNPGRAIPPESTKFHGVTDDMVVDKPPLDVVLPQFKAYAADAVLVAHNAAFDLKFIRMREAACGVTFDNPVLDTMLLSSFIDGTPEGQSLDAIAERYGITLADRHTALGDSLVTAAVLLRLIAQLEERGIKTLDQALTTLNMTMELHNRVTTLQ